MYNCRVFMFHLQKLYQALESQAWMPASYMLIKRDKNVVANEIVRYHAYYYFYGSVKILMWLFVVGAFLGEMYTTHILFVEPSFLRIICVRIVLRVLSLERQGYGLSAIFLHWSLTCMEYWVDDYDYKYVYHAHTILVVLLLI